MSDKLTQEVATETPVMTDEEQVSQSADPVRSREEIQRERLEAAMEERGRLLREEFETNQRRLREEGARRISRAILSDEA